VNDKIPSQEESHADLRGMDYVKDLLAAGYGKWEEAPPPFEGGPTIGHFILTFKEMVEMGEAERLRLGVEPSYQFALAHGAGKPTQPTLGDQP